MRDLYASHAAALRDALRHAVERGGMSSLGVLHQGVPSPSSLTGTDATAQAARVRRQLDRLAPLSRALLVIAYAPRSLKCSCGARCCAGRLLGITANELTQMRSAANLMGVSSDTMTAGFQSLQDTLQDARWGRNQGAFATLQALGIRLKTAKNGAIDTKAAMYDLADRMQRIQKRDPAAARNLARSLGVEQLLPVLIKGRAGMQAYEAEARRLRGDFTPEMTQRAESFMESLSKMGQAAAGLKATIADKLAPILQPLIDKWTNWLAKSRGAIGDKIAATVQRIADMIGRIDPDKFLDGLMRAINLTLDFVGAIAKLIDQLGGFKAILAGVALYMGGGFIASLVSTGASIAGLVWRVGVLARMWGGAGAAASAAAAAITGAGAAAETAGAAAAAGVATAEGAAGAGAGAAGTAGAGAAAAGRRLTGRMFGGLLRFVNPATVAAYLALHSEDLNTGEDDQLKRIRAAEAASGGQWTGANFQPTDAMKNATVEQWSKRLNFGGLEKQYGLPPGLLSAVVQVESRGDASAVSPAGAAGLFQFMPATAKEYGINPLDPTHAAGAAAKKLGGLMQRYHGNLSAALAAYNWGEGNLDRKGMANAPLETQQYGPKVMAALKAYGGDASAMDSGDAMPPLNAPAPQLAAAATPVVHVNTRVHVERDGRASVRTETPNGLHVAYPMAGDSA